MSDRHPVAPASLESIRAPIASDLARVDDVIRTRLDSEVVLIRTIAEYIVQSGGKRLRPALVLLAASAFGQPAKSRHELAAVQDDDVGANALYDL